jgi:transcriptional regulator with XRE-family HTH domain
MKNNFPKNLRALRKLVGITQEDLSNETGIKRGTIGSYEEGRAEPSFDNLLKICHALCESPNTLICGSAFLDAYIKKYVT